jgi:hypothetical protein
MLALATSANASVVDGVTLQDRNSVVTVEMTSGNGISDWIVDEVNHLYRQWFWYRIGDAGGESPLNTLGLLEYNVASINSDPNNELLTTLYGDPNTLTVEVFYKLAGGNLGSGQSDLAETITITNHGPTAMDFHFFQYCDLDLGGTVTDQSVQITGGNTAEQCDPNFYSCETVVTPRPGHYEVNFYSALLTSLGDSNPTTLADTGGPIGPGDLTWAFQWDFSIPQGESFIISKDKLIIPEPATLMLLGLGGVTLLIGRRAKQAI